MKNKEKIQEKDQKKQNKEKIENAGGETRDYYEAESWQFSSCGD